MYWRESKDGLSYAKYLRAVSLSRAHEGAGLRAGARKPAPSFPVKNDLTDNRCAQRFTVEAASEPPARHLRPLLIDRFVLIDR